MDKILEVKSYVIAEVSEIDSEAGPETCWIRDRQAFGYIAKSVIVKLICHGWLA
jgi:hypothetical protein